MEGLISRLCSFMGVFALFQTFLPPPLRQYLDRGLAMLWEKLFQTANSHVELQVEEKVPGSHNLNVFYRQVGVYLSSLRSSIDKHSRLKVCRSLEKGSLSFSLPDNEVLEDSFEGARVCWTHECSEKEGGKHDDGYGRSDERSFTLRFLIAERRIIMPAYLDYISKLAVEIEHKNNQRFLYTNNYGCWEETPFTHPSTLDILALDEGLTDRIKADLDVFSKGENFYRRNGRAWKRGYLLYGPPGTGKSSMIAAIANHLEYDIYDLELTKVSDNADLKSLLMQTTRKSIIVIEDIDCSVQFSDRRAAEASDSSLNESDEPSRGGPSSNGSKLTLSGLLNFTDGLWSCCGEERIFIFTTNHKDRLDPALLRPGRMDMHILLSYCSFSALKKLASSYLGIQEHPMYLKLEEALRNTPHKITPAAMAEMLISNQSDPDAAFRQVMAALPSRTSGQVVVSDNNAREVMLTGLKETRVKKSRLLRDRTLFFWATIRGKHVD